MHKVALLKKLQKYKWRILAVAVFLVIFSPVAVVTYLSNREQLVYMNDEQWDLSQGMEFTTGVNPTSLYERFPKYYKVVLESIDDVQGIAHLRADLIMRAPHGEGIPPLPLSADLIMRAPHGEMQLLNFIPERLKTDETRHHPFPVEVLFGPFTIRDESDRLGIEPPYGYAGGRPPNFSESAPTSTQADVWLSGTPWWYPFDEYWVSARVGCEVVATPDQKKYFRILSDGYTLASKLPNFIVRTVNAKDMENRLGPVPPDIDLKETIKSYRTDFWRDGVIRLVLTRPLFPRFFAVFFLIIALAGIWLIAKVSDPKQWGLNVFGYFLAIWAIRAPLAAGAPSGPLFMDYATLGLYALLVAVVSAKFIWGFRQT